MSLFRTNHPQLLTMGSKYLPGIDRNRWKYRKKCTRGATGWSVSLVEPANFFEGGLRRAKCPVVAQTRGYHLVCIWGCLITFWGGKIVLKSMLIAGLWICLIFVSGLIPVFQRSVSPSNWGGFVSSWESCCCKDTGLSSDMHLGYPS